MPFSATPSMLESTWNQRWGQSVSQLARTAMQGSDSGHDLEHVKRVVRNAANLASLEGGDLSVVLPAAWLHDCIAIPKDDPRRSTASQLSAKHALTLLQTIQYPETHFDAIQHAIEAHSFSAKISCSSVEAEIVQDADRLEALGAIGLARCLVTGVAMQCRLYDPDEPFPVHREADDRKQSIDHFFVKLLRLPATMKTKAAREEAKRRANVLISFLRELGREVGVPDDDLNQSLRTIENS